jgi:hypothetical protein
MATIAHAGGFDKNKAFSDAKVLAQNWSAEEIEQTCQRHNHLWRDRFWNPFRTIWTFLTQVMHVGSSCRAAVAMALSQEAAKGKACHVSPDPAAYCQARQRLPLEVIRHGVATVGRALQQEWAQTFRWCQRNVWLVDGTTCSMPDTPDLQAAFGQPDGQKPGCGFPAARIVAMFCWASGAVIEAAVGPYRTSELALWRQLWHLLTAGDIVLGDRFFCTFFDMVELLRAGCDGVFRLHQKRPADFRQGRRLGKNDRLTTWQRPTWSARPRGMRKREWRRLPLQLTVRVLRIPVDIPGFRSRTIDVATSLTDPVAYPYQRIASLYRDRWLVELRLRDLKTTLGMDILRAKTPDVVGKEIYMHLLGYNLIRCLMSQAAWRYKRNLHELSFAGTVDRLNATAPYFWLYEGQPAAATLYELLLRWIAHDTLPYRPNRIEPRAVKRRPKEYPRLTRPRHRMQKALVK